jgi:predicted nucleic acid-binding protein
MAKYLLDTTVLIDYLAGRPKVVDLVKKLAREGHSLGVCCINIAELYSGLKAEKRPQADRLIDSLLYFEVAREISKLAGNYRCAFAQQGITLSTADTIVAGTAVANEAILITANKKDYPMDEIKVLKQS